MAGSLRRKATPAAPAAVKPQPQPFKPGVASKIGLRHVKNLTGGPATESMDLQVRLTVDARGQVTDVRARDPKDVVRLKGVRDRIVGVSIDSGNPDKATFKVNRGGTITCYKGLTCHLGIDILADEVRGILEL